MAKESWFLILTAIGVAQFRWDMNKSKRNALAIWD